MYLTLSQPLCQQFSLQVEPQQQLAQSPSLQSQNSWDTPFAMESYALRGVTPEGRTRSNSTVSASSMGGLITLDGVPMATKVRLEYPSHLRVL